MKNGSAESDKSQKMHLNSKIQHRRDQPKKIQTLPNADVGWKRIMKNEARIPHITGPSCKKEPRNFAQGNCKELCPGKTKTHSHVSNQWSTAKKAEDLRPYKTMAFDIATSS